MEAERARFELSLVVPPVLVAAPGASDSCRHYDPELDNLSSLLSDICERLEIAGVVFWACLCSEEPWPVDVQIDLVIVLEQLAAVVESIGRGEAVELRFYEQGIEQVVAFSPASIAQVAIECRHLLADPAGPSRRVVLRQSELFRQLTALAEAFLLAAEVSSPDVVCHPWFEQWSNALRAACGLSASTVQA
jgi:hypothetical protein